ncbi:MAG: hypothetical protein M1832_003756 [Thelocarpon impressellum]|nr:MAG: hypothetical protein M1832_003756 [Thelocarpon impressellum]
MPSLLAVCALVLPVVYAVSAYRSYLKYLAAAKQSGLRYIPVPLFLFNRAWLLIGRGGVVLLIRKLFPRSWLEPWLTVITPDWMWERGYTVFDQIGADTFLTVSPGGISMFTCEAEAISQITNRRVDFPKPTEFYGLLNVFGPNVVGSEGAIWRHHRKITSPPFTEKNNELVWAETISQTTAMMAGWLGDDGHGLAKELGSDTMRLTLHIISKAGFGKKLAWPVQTATQQDIPPGSDSVNREADISSSHVPPGHTLSYKDALASILASLLWVLMTPHILLKNSPFTSHKKAWEAYVQWRQYMTEMYLAKQEEIKLGIDGDGIDLMGALVRGSEVPENEESGEVQSTQKGAVSRPLTEDEVLGNAFIFLLAGHETTATTLQMALLYLACNPDCQIRLQEQLDSICKHQPTSSWHYEKDMPKLLGGYAGAVMSETLRLIPPVIGIPKITRAQPQPLTLDGRSVVVPSRTVITLDTVAAHRNPKYWPRGSPTSTPQSDAEEILAFRPERWLVEASEDLPKGGNKRGDAKDALFHPPRGAFIAFSEGHRACIGRRFAQVEVVTALATLFSGHSIELSVNEFASDEAVRKMPAGGPERKEAWSKAKAKADWMMTEGMGSQLTLRMIQGDVPIKIVKRGDELFR